MKLFKQNDKGELKETTLMKELETAFGKAKLKMDNGGWPNENCNWIGVVQENKKSQQITVNLTFENCGNKITGLKVYSADIRRVVDEENAKQIM